MYKIIKALAKLSKQEKKVIKNILIKIKSNSLSGFDIKKLKNYDNIFRIRKGSVRIIFKKDEEKNFKILAVEKRSDNTYKKL